MKVMQEHLAPKNAAHRRDDSDFINGIKKTGSQSAVYVAVIKEVVRTLSVWDGMN